MPKPETKTERTPVVSRVKWAAVTLDASGRYMVELKHFARRCDADHYAWTRLQSGDVWHVGVLRLYVAVR